MDKATRIKEYNKHYTKTVKGKLMKMYDAQKQRIKVRTHLTLEYSLQEFYDRFLNDKNYLRIHAEWVDSGYAKSKSPSIDRIDHKKGYSMENIQMTTWQENFKKSRKESRFTSVDSYDLSGNFLKSYKSIKDAMNDTGATLGNIIHVCKGNRNHTKNIVFRYSGESFRYPNHNYTPPEELERRAQEVRA